MTLQEAIQARHSVRKYKTDPIEPEIIARFESAIERINTASGLNIQLVLEEPKAFSAGLWKYGQFSGVRNYIVLAGPKNKKAEEAVGYYGEELVLMAQMLGLNTCWVGVSYKKIPGTYTLRSGDAIHCVISLGYGENQGVQHPQRPIENLYEAQGEVPQWFLDGVKAAALAPTAVNQQKFKFILHDGNKVEAKALFTLIGYAHIDLGIAQCHFEIGAGKENFEWI